MDSEEEEFLVQWLQMRGRLVAHVTCLVAQYCCLVVLADKINLPLDDHSLGSISESCKRNEVGASTEGKELPQISQILEKMDVIAALLREGNQLFRESYNPQVSGEKTLKLLQDCGCDEEKIPCIYWALMNDVAKLKIVIQCPPLIRKQVIMKMVFDS